MSEREAERDAQSMPKKPGWQILVDSTSAILNLTNEEWAMADRGTLADNLLRQVWSRLQEIIPQEHEGTIVFEVLRAAARVAEVPILSPNVVDFVVDRTAPEDLVVMLKEGLEDKWRLVQYEKGEGVVSIVPQLVSGRLAIIAEATVAEALEQCRAAIASGDRNAVMESTAAIYGAMMTGPFGGLMMRSTMCPHHSAVAAIMGEQIEFGPGEDLGDALQRAFPGHMVIGVGGPHAGLLEALLGRHRTQPGPETEPTCNCGTCPACMMGAADSATESAAPEPPAVPPAAPAEDPFGDQ